MKTFNILMLLLISLNIMGQRAPKEKKIYNTVKTENAPVIDGNLDDVGWNAIVWEENFIQHEPYEGKEPSQKTAFKLLYDDNYVYVAVKAYDTEPDKIVTRMSRRDDGQGDMIGIQFDSYYDKLTAFTFMVTAAGVKLDGIFSNDGGTEDFTWDAIWYVKTKIESDGWVTEMKIPLSQLRFNKNDEQIWGLEVARYIDRKGELSLWQHISKDASGWVHNFGELHGIKGIKPKRQIELQPYLVGKYEFYEKEAGNPYRPGKGGNFNVGLDGKIGLTNDLTLDFTVNPDFGQVEADPSEVNLTAFESYYQEKRPFFIEGKNILSFGLTPGDNGASNDNLFYTRRIGRSPHYYPDNYDYVDYPQNTTILGAFKLTGKTKNGFSMGVLESITQTEFAKSMLADKEEKITVEPFTNYIVSRVQKDFDKGNTQIGGMFTATNRKIANSDLLFIHKAAYTGGIDFNRSWKDKTYYINAKILFSRVEGDKQAILETQLSPVRYFQRVDNDYVKLDSNRTSLSGTGGLISFGKQGNGHWQYMTWINWRSPGLELNDVGFLRKTDDIFQVFWIQYRIWEPFGIFRSMSINMNQWSGWNFGAENTYNGGNYNFNASFKNFWNLSFGNNIESNSLDMFMLRGGPALVTPGAFNGYMFLNTDNRKKAVFSLMAMTSKGFDNANSYSNVGFGFQIRPSDALNISLEPSYTFVNDKMQYVTTANDGNKDIYLMASINQKILMSAVRINYNITPNLTVQYYGQPFIASGKYSEFKKITDARANKFSNRFLQYSSSQVNYDEVNEVFNFDDDNNGSVDFAIDKPDFKVLTFLSNMVVRWEYVPGSTLFLVWSQNRNDFMNNGDMKFGTDAKQITDIHPHNIFMVKFAYRFK